MKNIVGITYGSLTAIRPLYLNTAGVVVWEWQCKCGNVHKATGIQIKAVAKTAVNPEVPSCGCVLSKRAIETNTTHGYSKHPLFAVWQSIKQRCQNPNHKEYHRYGAVGVTICPEWADSAKSFIEWAISKGWKKGVHIDKDVICDLDNQQRVYSPQTCSILSATINVGHSSSRTNHARNKKVKLTPENVIEINKLYATGNYTQYQLAKDYGVVQATIWKVLKKNISLPSNTNTP